MGLVRWREVLLVEFRHEPGEVEHMVLEHIVTPHQVQVPCAAVADRRDRPVKERHVHFHPFPRA